jgi:serine protease Do
VTAGIVSAKGRSLPRENYVPFLQTDVAINPGNSGGPLFNLDGEVVGINSQIYSRTGGFMGLSFAIPIDVAIDVANQLKAKGKVSRGWLGLQIQDLSRELADSFGMDKPRGALVVKVMPDSPAEKAGFRTGDVVVKFNERPVETSGALPPLVARVAPGGEARAAVIRDRKPVELKVRVGELPDDVAARPAVEPERAGADDRWGLQVADLGAEERQQAELPQGGAVVRELAAGPGQQAGLRRGDIVTRVGSTEVKDAAHLRKLLAEVAPGKTVAVLVQRRNSPVYIAMRAPDAAKP